MNKKNPKKTPKTLMPLVGYKNLMEEKTLKVTLKETKHHNCEVETQGLSNLIGKENDGKPKRQLKHAQ